MSLEKKIEEKLNESLKNKDKTVFPTLRLIISAIKDFKIASNTVLNYGSFWTLRKENETRNFRLFGCIALTSGRVSCRTCKVTDG